MGRYETGQFEDFVLEAKKRGLKWSGEVKGKCGCMTNISWRRGRFTFMIEKGILSVREEEVR